LPPLATKRGQATLPNLFGYETRQTHLCTIMPRQITKIALLTISLFLSAATVFGQSTTGTVSMSATVSKFVELNSGGAVTLTGNSGGGVTIDGVANSPLAVSINLGELGPSNTNNFVFAQVPLKLRSNAAYVLSMSATVTSSGATSSRIVAADVGATSGDPTLAANGAVNGTSGRYEFTAVRSNLSAFSSATTALSGPIIMNAVPRSNANGLTVPAFFAIKPQFFENGTTTISVTFTVTAP
jgi:hypothetical protein